MEIEEQKKDRVIYAIPIDSSNYAENEDPAGISLAWLYSSLWGNKILISLLTIAGGILGVFLALSKPNVYSAKVVALAPDNGAGLDLGEYAGIAAMAGVGLPPSGGNAVEEIMALLSSRSMAEKVINEFNLRIHYNDTEGEVIEDSTFRAYGKDFFADHDSRTGEISFGYTHTDPVVAAKVANRSAEILAARYNENRQASGLREVEFLEARLEEALEDEGRAKRELSAFKAKTGTIEIETQLRATIEIVADLQGQLLALDMERRALVENSVGASNPALQSIEIRIEALNAELKELLGSSVSSRGVFVSLGSVPDLGIEYYNLARNASKSEAVVGSLMTQLEVSRINLVRSHEVITIIDSARIPSQKSGPARTKIAIIAMLVGALIGVSIAFMKTPFARSEIKGIVS